MRQENAREVIMCEKWDWHDNKCPHGFLFGQFFN
jgi:hypothetical protein